MNVLGHYLDLMTGEELPVITAEVAMLSDRLGSLHLGDASQQFRFDPRLLVLGFEYSLRPVAVRFLPNPAYTRAFRQMMSGTFEGPEVLPTAVLISKHLDEDYPCEMVQVETLSP